MTGLTAASFDVVSSLQEGLENVPGAIGATVRPRARVKDFSGGLAEGAKSLGWGIFDGLSGLVTEPMKGAKKGGLFGAIDGAATGGEWRSEVMSPYWLKFPPAARCTRHSRSYHALPISLTAVFALPARMASGGLGLVVHPATGAWRGARAWILDRAGDDDSVLTHPRREASVEAAKSVSKDKRSEIVHAWAALLRPEAVEARREELRRRKADAEGKLLLDPQLPVFDSKKIWECWQERRAEARARAAAGVERPELPRASTAPVDDPVPDVPDPRRSQSTAAVPGLKAMSGGL